MFADEKTADTEGFVLLNSLHLCDASPHLPRINGNDDVLDSPCATLLRDPGNNLQTCDPGKIARKGLRDPGKCGEAGEIEDMA